MDDPYDLNRFVQAQADSYARALAEIRGGRKRSHWMWYVFPQFDGLGSSSTLFAYVSPEGSAFDRLLSKYFRGERDSATLRLLGVLSRESDASGRGA